MKVIGLTGGIACGKSTVSDILRTQYNNVVIIDADRIAHEALQPGNPPYEAVVDHFVNKKGHTEILCSNNEIDRDALGKLIFANPEERRVLNSATHSWVFKQMMRRLWNEWSIWNWIPGFASRRDEKIVVLDVPLLFETKYFAWFCDKTIVVSVEPEELQLERLMKRNSHLSKEQADQRIRSQMPLSAKRARASFVIDNSGTLEQLESQVDDIMQRIKSSRWPALFQCMSFVGFMSAIALPIGISTAVIAAKL